jgi:hypothetical protein
LLAEFCEDARRHGGVERVPRQLWVLRATLGFRVVELIIGIVFQQEFLELFQYTKERALFMPFLVVYLPRKSSGLSFTTILATNTSNKAAHTGRAKERLPSKAAASSLGVVIIYRHISFSHQWLIIDPFV